MDSDQTGEETVAICSDCDTVYPTIRLPDGEVRRIGSYLRCRCGSKSIVPHGLLHHLPFATLHDGEQYLVEKHALRFAANATALTFLEEKVTNEQPQDMLVVGDPRGDLEYARDEVRRIAESHGTKPLVGEDAKISTFTTELEDADLAHLCCHGYYDPDSPRHSHLCTLSECFP